MKRALTILLILFTYIYQLYPQSFVMGNNDMTQIKVYEYYHHIGESKWVKLFRIKNYDAYLGFWGKGGVSGTLYYVDYQGEGASKIDFVFPQSIKDGQKPNLIASGNASRDFTWYALKNTSIEGQEYYDVYIKTSPWHVGFTFQIRGADYDAFFLEEDPPSQDWIWNTQNDLSSIFYLSGNSNVGIGTTTPDQKLTIKGKIHAEEVIVDLNVPAADYVFAKDYSLMPLHKVEQYVKTNAHLPDVPSATEIKDKGLSMGEMQNKLLQKIEELTLYAINQNKQLSQQNKKIAQLENEIQAMKK